MDLPYIHRIDPIFLTIGPVHLWWYGLSYSLGFINAHLSLRRHRRRLGLSLADVYELSLLLAAGVLIGGRGLVVFRHEWTYYKEHLALIPALWVGGLATHGLIIGGFAGILLFCLVRRQPFRPIFDALAIPAALILGCGRIGNFIDGQIVGSVTTLPWGVQFPDVDGIRHPVVLYDGLKNFLIVPILLAVQRRGVAAGSSRQPVRAPLRGPTDSDRPAAGVSHLVHAPAGRPDVQRADGLRRPRPSRQEHALASGDVARTAECKSNRRTAVVSAGWRSSL